MNGEHCAKAADYFLAFMHTHEDSPARNCAEGYQTGSQPVIVFEMAWNILSLAVLWKLKDRLRPDGMLFAVYIALYSVGRFAISFLREDRVWALGMQETHYISLLALAIVVPLVAIKGGFTSPTPAIAEGGVDAPRLRGTRAERRRRGRR